MEFEWDSFEKETKVEKKNVEKMFVCMMTIVLGLSSAGWAASMGTAFTYQGRLTDGGSPASGPYDLQFKLYDAASVGGQVGGTITLDNITVSDGLFTVQLDFGGSAFDGGCAVAGHFRAPRCQHKHLHAPEPTAGTNAHAICDLCTERG